MNTFGDLLRQHLSRKRGLSQNKLALDIDVDPSVISKMCNGKRLNGRYSRERMLKIITWLYEKEVLEFIEEANDLLSAADMTLLEDSKSEDLILLNTLAQQKANLHSQLVQSPQDSLLGLLLIVLGIHLLGKFILSFSSRKTVLVIWLKS